MVPCCQHPSHSFFITSLIPIGSSSVSLVHTGVFCLNFLLPDSAFSGPFFWLFTDTLPSLPGWSLKFDFLSFQEVQLAWQDWEEKALSL